MFETAALHHRATKQEYHEAVGELRYQLLQAQFAVRDLARFPVLVVIDGVPGAGRSDTVNLLKSWLDVRELEAHAFGGDALPSAGRPEWWKYWSALPQRGRLGLYFGSWYSDPLHRRAKREISEAAFRREIGRIAAFERTLSDDGALIVKFWLHLSERMLAKRLDKLSASHDKRGRYDPGYWSWLDRYRRNVRSAGLAILGTETSRAPWHRVAAADRRHRELTVGRTLLHSMRRATEAAEDGRPTLLDPVRLPAADVSLLEHVDPDAQVSSYGRRLRRHQQAVGRRAWKAYDAGISTVLVFEGQDAAGKGGAIRRVVRGIDARLVRVHRVSAPSEEEQQHHWLWRFWRRVPAAGRIAVFDRSWYGRVLVERVEGFASDAEWMRSYQEINEFEEHLTQHGVLLLKFFLHIDADEQLRRFEARKQTPHKRHKITDEDWRNREKWHEYQHAIGEMVARTSTPSSPWRVIPANSKKHARVQIAHTVARALRERLQAR